MSEQESSRKETYLDQLAKLSGVSYRRLMYGEWLVQECEQCHGTKNIKRYVDTARGAKQPVYLCDACMYAGHGTHTKQLRGWLPEDR